ncbi:hypothetical protein JOC77_000146 [Peribacillus deserti]|uniref:Uncharacterized protein n=1 Tax=Peribacillus deserti TaxID=673318 RepID=A0ABS2QE14_9BACI|nr:hypothetical protein [Peribacillus deserti]MBM7690743.1 hypothetical protein [Peribacillus deserti]
MKRLLQKANEHLSKTGEDGESRYTLIQNKLGDRGINIPITADILKFMIQNKQPHESIHKMDVEFYESFLRFSGKAKKFLMEIKFEIDLQPLKAEKRVLFFEVKEMKPLNQDWIKSRIFNRPPLLSYIEGNMILDLNQLEAVRKVPLGSIKHFELKDDKLWVKLGL